MKQFRVKAFQFVVFAAIFFTFFELSAASEQPVLMINVHGSSYDGDGQHIYDTLVNAGVDATYVNLSTSSQNNLVALLQDPNNQYDQVWVFDLSSWGDSYPAAWQAIADWFNKDPTRAIICDGRMISSYWSGRWTGEGQKLTENYYENMKINGGGLLLGTDHYHFHSGINTVNNLIGIQPFSGRFVLSWIPVDTSSSLMTFPNNLGEYLRDDSSPGQTPYGLQPNGRILYSVAWHSGNHNTPGISSTIEGVVGVHVKIEAPETNSQFLLKLLKQTRSSLSATLSPLRQAVVVENLQLHIRGVPISTVFWVPERHWKFPR